MANLLWSFEENPDEEVATKIYQIAWTSLRLGKTSYLIFFNDGGIGNSLHLGFLFCFNASTKRRNETKWNLSKINGLLSTMKRKHAPIAFTLVFPSSFYTLELDSLSSEYRMNWDEEYFYCVRASCLCILIVSYVMTLCRRYQEEASSTQLNNIEPGSSSQIM